MWLCLFEEKVAKIGKHIQVEDVLQTNKIRLQYRCSCIQSILQQNQIFGSPTELTFKNLKSLDIKTSGPCSTVTDSQLCLPKIQTKLLLRAPICITLNLFKFKLSCHIHDQLKRSFKYCCIIVYHHLNCAQVCVLFSIIIEFGKFA